MSDNALGGIAFVDPDDPPRPTVEAVSGSWSVRAITSFHDGPALCSFTRGDAVTLRAASKGHLSLVLLRHDWSGGCEITVGEHRVACDLYSVQTETVDVPVPRADGAKIRLVNRGATNPHALATECWLVGFRQGGSFWPIELGEPISRTARLIRGKLGTFLTLRTDTGVADSLALHGIWDEEEVTRFAEYVRPEMTVIDAGANFGHHSIALAKLVGSRGRVLAIEPQSAIHYLLCANVAINAAWQITPLHCALGERQGTARMNPVDYESAANIGSLGLGGSAEDEHGGELTEVLTLDDVVARHLPQCRVGFVKIDVQSFELYVLRGALEVISRHRPVMQIEISPFWMQRRGYGYQEISLLLQGYGYVCHNLAKGHPDPLMPYAWDGVTDIEWNMLALPPAP